MPFPNIDPVAFAIGPLEIRWYALAYIFGVLLGALYGVTLLRRKTLWKDNEPPLSPSQLYDFAFWAIIGIVIGGRLGYVIFYDPIRYAQHPLEIFATWDGGMSFHGGMLGITAAMWFYTKRYGLSFLSGMDLLSAISPIGLLLGRIANFINGELFGKPTDLPWGVIFPYGGDMPRHPSQLYEAALEGLVLFLILRFVTHLLYGLRRPGLVAGVFLMGYAISRCLVEFVRLPDPQVGYLYNGWLTLGMVYSVPLFLAGLALLINATRRKHG